MWLASCSSPCAAVSVTEGTVDQEWIQLLHEQIGELPERYRAPVVMLPETAGVTGSA
jgi:hypothetical protein